MNSDDLVDYSLIVLGPLNVLDSTRKGLKKYASKFINLSWENDDKSYKFDEAAVSIIQLIVSTQEYQTVQEYMMTTTKLQLRYLTNVGFCADFGGRGFSLPTAMVIRPDGTIFVVSRGKASTCLLYTSPSPRD